MTTLPTIAVLQGAAGVDVQALLRSLAMRWRMSARVVGVLEVEHGLGARACGAGYLQNLSDGRLFRLFQDLGPGSTACHLDSMGLSLACEAVRHDIAAGCDLVVLNRFAKSEAGRQGLISAFMAAVDAGVPVLTSVSPVFMEAWMQFAAPLFVMLPAETDRVEGWWTAVQVDRRNAKPPQAIQGFAAQ